MKAYIDRWIDTTQMCLDLGPKMYMYILQNININGIKCSLEW